MHALVRGPNRPITPARGVSVRVRATVAALLAITVGLLATATPAAAHDPLFVDDNTPLADSPLIEDGTVSFATYGVITGPTGAAHLRLRLAAGHTLTAELLVPDRPPENTRSSFSHLHLRIVSPGGGTAELHGAGVLQRFDEPFSGTSYLRLIAHTAPARSGITELTVTSDIPTRFTLATGTTERFGSPVSNNPRRQLSELATWYDTPPAGVSVPVSAGPTSAGPTSAGPTSTGPTSTGPETTEGAAVGATPRPDPVSDPAVMPRWLGVGGGLLALAVTMRWLVAHRNSRGPRKPSPS